jgi:hypothetical protein
MELPKLEINNPEALALIERIRSGHYQAQATLFIKRHAFLLIAVSVVVLILISVLIGTNLSKNNLPILTAPELDSSSNFAPQITKSRYEPLKKEILDQSFDLPDPVIPQFDNALDLKTILN